MHVAIASGHGGNSCDVFGGVRLARKRGWEDAIRAGGNSFPAWSLHDDELVFDLRDLSVSRPLFRAESSTPIYLGTAASSPPLTVPPSASAAASGK